MFDPRKYCEGIEQTQTGKKVRKVVEGDRKIE
jgi:hypothetical protein